uniref:Serine-threonine kinase STK3 n=1 Tax=Cocos nucifera TaxID=13894 RepID=A0A0N7EZQ0_COCNU|nr:serine-threonine kinase STK3 [Cocos nucifera]
MAMIGFFLVLGISAAALVRGQPGFINIDCGIAENSSSINGRTGMEYVSDAQFVETGENHEISTDFKKGSPTLQTLNLRSFPTGDRNCYALKDVQKGNKYMIRAGFMYGNYDGQNRKPQFDLYVGVNHWDSMNITNASRIYGTEIMIVASASFISVCLVNTGFGPPFISILELRPLRNEIYKSLNASSYFLYRLRSDMGSTADRSTRYPDDVYDRMWYVANDHAWTSLNTSASISNQSNDGFDVPPKVMSTAATPLDGSNLRILGDARHDDPPSKYHIFLHFTEIQSLSEQSRIFDIHLNGNLWVGAFSPRYLETDNIVTEEPLSLESYNITIRKAAESTLPPILNAIEIYHVRQSGLETDGGDVDAIMEVKASYQVKRNWMGDPCVPSNFAWVGLNCSFDGSEPPRIISLNLAYGGLTGEITAALVKLESLRYLDLSGNSLSGPVPDALGELPYLEFLNLSSNQLTGSIPRRLQERCKDGSLKLSIENNPALCYGSDSCARHHKVSSSNHHRFISGSCGTAGSGNLSMDDEKEKARACFHQKTSDRILLLWTFQRQQRTISIGESAIHT